MCRTPRHRVQPLTTLGKASMVNKKGVRCVRKGPEMWPARFHEAIREAVKYNKAEVECYPTKKAAEAAARSMRQLWKRLQETPLHRSALLIAEFPLRLRLRDLTDIGAVGWWKLELLRSPSKNFVIRD